MASFSSFRHPSLPEPAGARRLAAALSSRWALGAGELRKSGSSGGGTAVGASGILAGLGTALAVMFPALKVRVSGTGVALPLRTLLPGMFAVDAYCLGTRTETGVGHAGHIGGALFGLAYATGRKAMGCWNV
ncbi:hypothetical protein C8035_v009936 [Colletotrichum spinosum]|uniref:Peptidase S54 rhomboid domain-containing protein n=1 Tax=Colletotrichum spinosum TaxID=1347390 RepID=A0A4R8QC70_9PEZI|nr:hypothetical protein C8035_v009936 [Colletotrichum spinosum]